MIKDFKSKYFWDHVSHVQQGPSLRTSPIDLKYFYCEPPTSCSECQPCPDGFVGATGCTGCINCLSAPTCIPICNLCKTCPTGYKGYTGCPEGCPGQSGAPGCTLEPLPIPFMKGIQGYLYAAIGLAVVSIIFLIMTVIAFKKGLTGGAVGMIIFLLIFLGIGVVCLLTYLKIIPIIIN